MVKTVASDEMVQLACKVFVNYCKGKGKLPTELTLDGEKNIHMEPND